MTDVYRAITDNTQNSNDNTYSGTALPQFLLNKLIIYDCLTWVKLLAEYGCQLRSLWLFQYLYPNFLISYPLIRWPRPIISIHLTAQRIYQNYVSFNHTSTNILAKTKHHFVKFKLGCILWSNQQFHTKTELL